MPGAGARVSPRARGARPNPTQTPMQSDLTLLTALCAVTAVLFAALGIRYLRKRSRVDLCISRLEQQLRERRMGQ